MISLPDARRDVLAVLERRIDGRLAGDRGGEQRGALVADVLELGDAHVLDAGGAGPLARARVLDRRGLEAASCECYASVKKDFDRLGL